MFLSQLEYWSDHTKPIDARIYKTADEWNDETMLSRHELDTVRKALKGKGVIEEKLAGIPAKVHYRLNRSALFDCPEAASATYWERIEQRQRSKFAGKRHTGNTETPDWFGGKRQPIYASAARQLSRERTNDKGQADKGEKAGTATLRRRARLRQMPLSFASSML